VEEKTVKNTVRPARNGGTFITGNPGNKGGTGRPPNALREKHGKTANLLAEFDAVQVEKHVKGEIQISESELKSIRDTSNKYFLPSQAEVVNIDDDTVIRHVYESLAEIGLAPEQIEAFTNAMKARTSK
jgi:hypothetical protein